MNEHPAIVLGTLAKWIHGDLHFASAMAEEVYYYSLLDGLNTIDAFKRGWQRHRNALINLGWHREAAEVEADREWKLEEHEER